MRSLLLLAGLAAPAAAETHGSLQAGGLVRFDSLSLGGWAAANLWTGGVWGLRVDLNATSGPLLVEGSVARALGATWRHLVVDAHAGAGADLDRDGISVAAGLASEIGIGIGPLEVVTDFTLHVVLWDGRHDLVVTGALGLAAAF